MRPNYQKGAGTMEGVVALIILATVIFLFVLPERKLGPTKSLPAISETTQTTVYTQNPWGSNSNVSVAPPITSTFSREINLNSGNAPYAYEPFEEYITINNVGQTLVDISGWQLRNGRGDRAYNVGGDLRSFPSITAVIPKGAGFISPNGQSLLQDVVLKPGETAIITTGSVGTSYPYRITSFKENECSGYLQNMSEYTFSPYLATSCVPPSQEPGLSSLDVGCQNFVTGLGSCQTPKFDANAEGYARDYQGNTCNGCVNGVAGLSNACVAFIKTHFSYPGCLTYHSYDPNFYSNTWRIFLGKPWEMWATDHESISLFDLRGNLAAYQSY
ncbi:lamin tail domain-containing protein [Candidatus Parcubacteria bacterium]|nr:lamin tail domain-containing protein [Candidatus Parcubacteria bacterium]